jgi:hypothetical protein
MAKAALCFAQMAGATLAITASPRFILQRQCILAPNTDAKNYKLLLNKPGCSENILQSPL